MTFLRRQRTSPAKTGSYQMRMKTWASRYCHRDPLWSAVLHSVGFNFALLQLSCGFFEIYKDEIFDLLNLDAKGNTVMLQHGSGRIQDRHLASLTVRRSPLPEWRLYAA
jgi:hypothetical protein